jgi:MFS family permease
MIPAKKVISLLPFWIFVLLFKFGAGLHFSLLSWFGSKVAPLWLVGIIMGVAAFVELILDVPFGYVLDRFGYRRMLKWGALAFILAALALTLNFTIWIYFLTVFLAAFGWLVYSPGTSAYVLSSSPHNGGGKFMGVFQAIGSAGIVLAAIAIIFAVRSSLPIIGLCIAGIIFVAMIFLYFAPTEPRSVHQEKTSEHQSYYIRRHFVDHLFLKLKTLSPALSLLLVQNMAASLFYGAIWFVVPLILAQNLHNGALGLGLSIFDMSVVVLGSAIGKLADKADSRHLVFCGLLLFAAAASIIGFNLNIWFLVLGFLATTGDELSEISLWSWINRIDKKHTDDGLINGAVACFNNLGWAIGPVLAGLIYGIVGSSWTIAISAIPIFLTWLIFSFSTFFSKYFRASSVIVPIQGNERLYRLRHKR